MLILKKTLFKTTIYIQNLSKCKVKVTFSQMIERTKKCTLNLYMSFFWTFKVYKASILTSRSDFKAWKLQKPGLRSTKKAIKKWWKQCGTRKECKKIGIRFAFLHINISAFFPTLYNERQACWQNRHHC